MSRNVTSALALAGGMIALALGATLARRLGYIDQDAFIRIVIGANGLMIAWYGNLMPKSVAPSACAGRVNRVGGWAMVLSGLVYCGLWIFAPIPLATIGGCLAIVAGIAVTLFYCLSLRTASKTA